ncbi:MAG: hypothetical protein PHR35_23055 [Kiritimatiellae bacterium]|nr:hypothetical protein [Kiritimatiellia bacterium]
MNKAAHRTKDMKEIQDAEKVQDDANAQEDEHNLDGNSKELERDVENGTCDCAGDGRQGRPRSNLQPTPSLGLNQREPRKQ